MMRRRIRWLLAVIIAAVAAVVLLGILWPDDKNRLKGTWAGNGVRLTFEGDLAVLDGPGYSRPVRTYFRLDPRASPKRIVLWDADDPNLRPPTRVLGVEFGTPSAQGPLGEMRGVYELLGDRLRLCMSLPGADFPEAFDPAAGPVLDLRRE